MALFFYGWWVVLACFFVALYVGGTTFGFTAFFEPITQEFGWSYTHVSIAFSIRGLEMGMLAPIMGFLVDRFGSRRVVFSGVVITGFGLILITMTNSLVMFYAAFILLAIGASGCTSTVLMTAAAQWFRRNVGKAMGIVACGFGAGGILIPPIVWLIDLYQWRTTLIVLGLGTWAMGIPLSFVIHHRPEQHGYSPDGGILAEPSPSRRGRDVDSDVTVKEALKKGDFWKIGFVEAIRMMIAMAVVAHVIPYLSSIGMSRVSAAFIATSIPLLSIFGRFGFGWLGDTFDKKYVMACVYSLLGMGTLALSYIHVKWFIFIFLLVFPLAFGGAVPLRGAIVREYFGRTSFGGLFGMIMSMASIGGVIGPIAAGYTFDSMGRYRPVWLCFAATTVIAVVTLLGLKVPRPTSEGQESA